MLSLFRSAPRPFRTRSPDRDRETDVARAAQILAAVQSALRDARTEHDGLVRRVEVAKAQAAGLLGDEPFEYQERDPTDERALAGAEKQLVAASRRVEALRIMLRKLESIEQSALDLAPDTRVPISR